MNDTQKILNKLSLLEKQIAFLAAEVERIVAMLRQGGLL
jgi:uncharacterized small protein (DUF1192 family)